MQQPLTIVICVDHASVTGGQAKVAIESALGLKRDGARPIVFAAAGPVDQRLADSDVETICLGQHDLLGNPSRAAAAMQGTWNRPAVAALNELLARLPRDRTVVHVHGWAKALSPSIAAPIRASGLPAAFTIHDYFLFCPNGGFYNYQKNEVCTLAPLSVACACTHCDARNYTRKLWRAGRLVLAQRYADLPHVFSHYICISDYQAKIVAGYLPEGSTVHRLSNPIEASDLGPKANPSSGAFVFVGRLSRKRAPRSSRRRPRAPPSGRHSSETGRRPTNCAPSIHRPNFSAGYPRKPRATGCGPPAHWCFLRSGTRDNR